MLLEKIEDILLCPLCGRNSVTVINNRVVASCCDKEFKIEEDQIIIVDQVIPMNISNNVVFDRLLCALPFSNLFSRMIIVQGRKISDDN